MSNLKDKFSGVQSNQNIHQQKDTAPQQSLYENDIERHQKFFNSLSSTSKKGVMGLFATALVLVAAVATGLALKTQDVSTQDSSASSECEDHEILVEDNNGDYCMECEQGAFGTRGKCVQESPSGNCGQTQVGCFIPLL